MSAGNPFRKTTSSTRDATPSIHSVGRVTEAARLAVIALLCVTGSISNANANDDTTEITILGVAHSGMLVAKSYRPAVLRAYIDRVKPDAICIERSPEQFARGSYYEFTYEIQGIAVPYAREQGIELCPIDWMPAADDQLLAFGVDLQDTPFVRSAQSYANFLTYSDAKALSRSLFFAEPEAATKSYRDWYSTVPEKPRYDFARRLFLYRTFLQSMRVAKAARQHPGGKILVIIGAMHKDDMQNILADEHGVRVVSPEHFGYPGTAQIEAQVRTADLAAIATFNLLGAQAQSGNVDWAWLRQVVKRLQSRQPGPESQLLRTRLDVLTGAIEPSDAVERYRAIQADAGDASFTWTGVLDHRRVDSFADPFGDLSVQQRAKLEEGRELFKLGNRQAATAIRDQLAADLTPLKAGQLRAYWPDWLESTR